jgi:hypothetical protein
MSTTQRVSDEVWRSVPARTLPAGRVWAALGVVAALLVTGIWASSSGLIVPDLRIVSSGASSTADSGRFELRFEVTNEGVADVEVTGARLDAAWLGIESLDHGRGPDVDGFLQTGQLDLPFTIPAGVTVPARMVVTVDCDQRQDVAVPIVLEARSTLGTHDVRYQPWGSPPMVVGESMDEQPWPVAVSDWVCTPYTDEDLEE